MSDFQAIGDISRRFAALSSEGANERGKLYDAHFAWQNACRSWIKADCGLDGEGRSDAAKNYRRLKAVAIEITRRHGLTICSVLDAVDRGDLE